MIRVYSNSSSLHNVSKVEVIDGYGEGVRRVVIHQVVENNRHDESGTGNLVTNINEHGKGSLILKHEITIHPVKDSAPIRAIEMEVS